MRAGRVDRLILQPHQIQGTLVKMFTSSSLKEHNFETWLTSIWISIYHELNVSVELWSIVLSVTNQLYSAQELRKLYSLDTVFQVGFQVDLKIKHLDGALNKYLLTHLQFEVLLDSLHKAIGVAQILEMLFKVTIHSGFRWGVTYFFENNFRPFLKLKSLENILYFMVSKKVKVKKCKRA